MFVGLIFLFILLVFLWIVISNISFYRNRSGKSFEDYCDTCDSDEVKGDDIFNIDHPLFVGNPASPFHDMISPDSHDKN